MSENKKENEGQKCCCCKCWGRIFITIALLAIGAVIGHVMTMRHHCCHYMRGLCGGGYGREASWDRGEREREGRFEHKFREEKEGRGEREEKGWFGHKAAGLSEPNKAGCPMMGKREGKSEKD